MNPRPDRTYIPEVVAESVDRYIDSLDGLELFIFLVRNKERAWTSAELAVSLGIELARATRSLGHLWRTGLCVLETREDGESAYRYAPRGPEELAAAARIADAYGTRRIALINYVASEALNRIRALGEAFRVKQDKGNE